MFLKELQERSSSRSAAYKYKYEDGLDHGADERGGKSDEA